MSSADPTECDTTVWGPAPRVIQLRQWATRRFVSAGIGVHEVRVLLEWALGTSLLTCGPRATTLQAETFRTAVLKRHRHIPLQHVVGRMWFRTLELQARPGVFVVRPETEVVAGFAIEAAREAGTSPLVVDLCTGSGAIAFSLAAEVSRCQVVAVDLSDQAVELARSNQLCLERSGHIPQGSVRIVAGDATQATTVSDLDGQVDVVVSNPPYVPGKNVVAQAEAAHDPLSALYGGGEDGMVVPRGIITRAAALLKPGGTLVMEHAESQAQACQGQAMSAGLVDIATRQDLTGRPRALVARKPRGACDNRTVSKSIMIDATQGFSPQDLETVVAGVRAGQLLVLPTDTVYGIGANAANPAAVMDLLAAKGRGRHMPPPVLVANTDDMDRIAVNIPVAARRLAAAHWPGGLTLIVQARPDLGWDLGQTGGTVALRMPDHPVALAILRQSGPLAVTSANVTGQPPATNCQQAQDYFAHTVSFYVDAGPTSGSTPSTIIDCAHGPLTAIRLGTLDLSTLAHTAGEPIRQK